MDIKKKIEIIDDLNKNINEYKNILKEKDDIIKGNELKMENVVESKNNFKYFIYFFVIVVIIFLILSLIYYYV
jgi:hypothetical protein